MNKHLFSIAIGLFLGGVFSMSFAEETTVANAKALRKRVASAKPGDVILMKAGRWHNQHIRVKGFGRADQPIVIRAEQPGKTWLTGNSYLHVDGQYISIEGLTFRDGALDEKGHVIKLSGAHHRLTNTAILNYNPPSVKTRYFWLSLLGDHHRIDHNHFSGQNHSGVTLVVRLNKSTDGRHYIAHNYFGQRARGDGNGFETIRIGTGRSSHIHANTFVEYNVFDACDGEAEIISNKSNHNVYRYNRFVNSMGTLTLRQGQYNVVANNVFIADHKKGTGGVRITGTNQLVYGNYFEGLQSRAHGVISIIAGTSVDKKKGYAHYPRVAQTVIAGNRFKNNAGTQLMLNAGIGSKFRKLPATYISFTNNFIYSNVVHSRLVAGLQNDTIFWRDNYGFTMQLGDPSSIEFHALMGLDRQKKPTYEQALALVDYQRQPCEKVVASLDASLWDRPLLAQMCQRAGTEALSEVWLKNSQDVGVSWLITQ